MNRCDFTPCTRENQCAGFACISGQCFSFYNRTHECQAGPIYKCPYYPCHLNFQCYEGYCDTTHGYCADTNPYYNYTDPTCDGLCPSAPCQYDSDCGSGQCIFSVYNSSQGICSGVPPDQCLNDTSNYYSPNYNARYNRCDGETCDRDSECSSLSCDPDQLICVESQWSYNAT